MKRPQSTPPCVMLEAERRIFVVRRQLAANRSEEGEMRNSLAGLVLVSGASVSSSALATIVKCANFETGGPAWCAVPWPTPHSGVKGLAALSVDSSPSPRVSITGNLYNLQENDDFAITVAGFDANGRQVCEAILIGTMRRAGSVSTQSFSEVADYGRRDVEDSFCETHPVRLEIFYYLDTHPSASRPQVCAQNVWKEEEGEACQLAGADAAGGFGEGDALLCEASGASISARTFYSGHYDQLVFEQTRTGTGYLATTVQGFGQDETEVCAFYTLSQGDEVINLTVDGNCRRSAQTQLSLGYWPSGLACDQYKAAERLPFWNCRRYEHGALDCD